MSIKIQDGLIRKETFYIERTACLEKEKQRQFGLRECWAKRQSYGYSASSDL